MSKNIVKAYEIQFIIDYEKNVVNLWDISMCDVLGLIPNALHCHITLDLSKLDGELQLTYQGCKESGWVIFGIIDEKNKTLHARTIKGQRLKSKYGVFNHSSGYSTIGKCTYRDTNGRYYGLSLTGESNVIHCASDSFFPLDYEQCCEYAAQMTVDNIPLSEEGYTMAINYLSKVSNLSMK